MAVKHQAKMPKLNRDSKHRTALFRIQLCELIEHGFLTTTVTKAKIIKRHFDKLATKAKIGTLASRRLVIAELGRPKIAHILVDTIMPAMGDRQSGFTSLRKVDVRRGDATAMATLKLLTIAKEVKEEKVVADKVKKAK
jgi:large subunit ribosomal protein L17